VSSRGALGEAAEEDLDTEGGEDPIADSTDGHAALAPAWFGTEAEEVGGRGAGEIVGDGGRLRRAWRALSLASETGMTGLARH